MKSYWISQSFSEHLPQVYVTYCAILLSYNYIKENPY